MPDLVTTRHDSIFDPIAFGRVPVHIIGAGATGSRIWMQLVELGMTNITVWDFDRVEEHNLANQIYNKAHVGNFKVSALKMMYKLKTGETPPDSMKFNKNRVTEIHSKHMAGLIFILTDTMKSRREIMHGIARDPDNVIAVIETRMASSYGDINVVNPNCPVNMSQWYDSLIDDDDAEASPCGASISVSPTANVIASMAVWQMINVLTDTLAVDSFNSIYLKPFALGKETINYDKYSLPA